MRKFNYTDLLRGQSFKIACVYVGVILGAGFASGQEILRFFMSYGKKGFMGLMLAGLLFAIAGWAVLGMVRHVRPRGSGDFILKVFGTKVGAIIEWSSFVFMLILYCTMLAGSGALAKEAFGLSNTTGIVIMAVICFITLLFNLKGFVSINVVLSPILVVGGIIVGIYSILFETAPAFFIFDIFTEGDLGWLLSAIIYVSYNYVTTVNVLSQMPVESDRVARNAGVLGGLVMGILGLFLAIPLYTNLHAAASELPMLVVTRDYGAVVQIMYSIVLFVAIYTTAIANGFAVVTWVRERTGLSSFNIKLVFTIIAIIFAHFGFSNFVGKVYPMFGFIGLIEFAVISLAYFLLKLKKIRG